MSHNPLTAALLPTIDRLVEARYSPALDAVQRLADDRPEWDVQRRVDALIADCRRELTAIGAAAGGAAAVPGAGLAAAATASTADIAWTVTRLGELIMAIGIAHGHTSDSIETRRAWVLSVLSMATGASKGLKGLAQQVGSKGGARVVEAIPMPLIDQINRAVGGRVLVKWGTQQGAVRLGRLVPFGIGAVIGGAGNALLVQVVGRQAQHFFDVTG